MSDAYVIESAGETAGIVVAERSGVRFYAAEPAFYALDGRQFRSLRTARQAVSEVQRARTRPRRRAA